jgi:hypothetical protein
MLINQILKFGALRFVARGRLVREVLRNHIDVGLLAHHSAGSNVS